MGYIQEVRALVGTRPLVLVSAMVVILDDGGRILMQRRARTGRWHVPGGYLEPGESIEDTARREALEETALRVRRLELAGVYSGADFHWFAPNGDEIYNVTVAFVARNFVGEPQADGAEGTAVRFYVPKDLPADLGPPAGPVVEDLRRRGVLQ